MMKNVDEQLQIREPLGKIFGRYCEKYITNLISLIKDVITYIKKFKKNIKGSVCWSWWNKRTSKNCMFMKNTKNNRRHLYDGSNPMLILFEQIKNIMVQNVSVYAKNLLQEIVSPENLKESINELQQYVNDYNSFIISMSQMVIMTLGLINMNIKLNKYESVGQVTNELQDNHKFNTNHQTEFNTNNQTVMGGKKTKKKIVKKTTRCVSKTAKGTRCRRTTKKGKKCGIHK